MAFKPPGGELTGWSLLWILAGVLGITVAAVWGPPSFFLYGACVGLPALGMWFEQRWCGLVIAAMMAVGAFFGLIALVMVDDTPWEWTYRASRIAMASYFAYLTFTWSQDD